MKLTKEQVRQTLVSPIMYVDNKRSEIDSRKENYLFCSSGYEDKAYRGTVVVDASGRILKIKKVSPVGRLLFWTSLKYFSPVREVEPEIEGEIDNISVDELKDFILDTISKKKKTWLALDTFENISKDIRRCVTHRDIIVYFNKGLK